MANITVRYSALSQGSAGLLATWGRIEQLLAELDAQIARTSGMQTEAINSYRALKAKWNAAATERQENLKRLGQYVAEAGVHYRKVDAALAAQFI